MNDDNSEESINNPAPSSPGPNSEDQTSMSQDGDVAREHLSVEQKEEDGMAMADPVVPATPQSIRSNRSSISHQSMNTSRSRNSVALTSLSSSSRRRRSILIRDNENIKSVDGGGNDGGDNENDDEFIVPSTPLSKSSSKKRRHEQSKSTSDHEKDSYNEEESVPATPLVPNRFKHRNQSSSNHNDDNSNINMRSSNDVNIDNVSVGTGNTGYDSYGMGGGSTVRSMTSFASRQSSLRSQTTRGQLSRNNDDTLNDSDEDDDVQINGNDDINENNNDVNQVTPIRQNNIQSRSSLFNQQEQLLQDEELIPTNAAQPTVLRGTDINVHSVQLAFKELLQNFVSLEDSEKVIRRKDRSKRNAARREKRRMRKEARRGRADGGDGDDDDNSWDDSLSSIDSFDSIDEDENNNDEKLYYMEKLKDILLGRHNTKESNNDGGDAMISSTAITTSSFLDLNTIHLYYHSPQCQRLYHQLIMYPAEIIPLFDLIVEREMEALLQQLHDEKIEAEENNNSEVLEEYDTLHPLNVPVPRVQVRPFNLKSLSHMRALDPQSIDSLLSIRGMIVRSTHVIPDLKVAHFECAICSANVAVTLERGRVSEPTVCPQCNTKNGFDIIHNRSIFADKQMIRIQETPNEVPPGETPASIVLFAYDDLVDAVRPGDRVEVTGVFRAQGRRVNPKISKVKSVYKTYVDVVHFRRVSGSTADQNQQVQQEQQEQRDAESTNNEAGNNQNSNDGNLQGKGVAVENIGGKLSNERIEQLEKLAKSPDIYERLVRSLAPSIWELDDVKRGILCMLFGGNSKRVKKGTAERKKRLERERRVRAEKDDSDDDTDILSDEDDGDESKDDGDASKLNKRGDINILLCGDPGTSKSQLLSYVHKLSPRGVYTSGKGSSAVGLTASVVRDPETKDLVLESGALVLSDLGICCIDEFDKMSDTTRAILHEAMEQQTVSVAKAGIIATLNARTSILASANPVESRYNPQLSVVDNIKLPPTLLSRFDLIYLILDAPNVESDRRLAQHLVGLYYETPNVVQPPLDQSLLRDYIAYARDNIYPELSDLATRELISAYLEMRKMGASNGNGSRTISATPRQLESLIRLSEGLAKMRYSRVVERLDVKEAVRLMKVATQAAATDPRTGRIDMDMITTGRSTANREMEEALNLSLKELLAERRGNRMTIGDVRTQLSEIMNVAALRQEDVIEGLRILEADGVIQLNERAQTIFVRAGVIA